MPTVVSLAVRGRARFDRIASILRFAVGRVLLLDWLAEEILESLAYFGFWRVLKHRV